MATKDKGRRKTLVERAAFAVGHRIRIEALTIFNDRVASPNEIAKEIDEDLNLVNHHIKELDKYDCVELVKLEPRGGAVEHFYRATRRAELSDEEWEALSDGDRREIAAAGLRLLFAEGLASIQSGRMSRDSRMCIWWKAAHLDEEGRQEAADEQAEHIGRLKEIEARSNARVVNSGEEKKAPSTILAVLGFTRSRAGRPAVSAQ